MSVSKPTKDDAEGMEWWNRIPESERRWWTCHAQSARPVDAWREYKRWVRQGLSLP